MPVRLCLALLFAAAGAALAQSSFDENTRFDELVRKDGSTLSGLILSETADAIEFLVVWRRKHQKTLTMKTTVAKADLVAGKSRRLTAEARAALLAKVRGTKATQRGESAAIARIALKPIDGGHDFVGKRFHLTSSAGEDFTKRAVYRLERIFEAFEQYFPVTRRQEARVRIVIFGDSASYQRAVGRSLKNGAVYIPSKNLVLAGTDLVTFKAKVAATRTRIRELRVQVKEHRKDLIARRKAVDAEVRKHENDVRRLRKAKQLSAADAKAHLEKVAAWEKQQRAAIASRYKQLKRYEAHLSKVNRSNTAFMNRYAGDMMRRLYHEAFHAFVDNFLFTAETSERVPHWLHEGLAQFFEHSFIEGDTLRIGAFDPRRVAVLKSLVADKRELPLAQLLAAKGAEFLVESGHPEDVAKSTRAYVQSWAVVYWLAHRFDLRKQPIFDVYIRELAAGKSHTRAFEMMTGMTLAEADAGWKAQLQEKPR